VSVLVGIWQHRRGRLGLVLSVLLIVTALGADLLASHLPLAVRIDGRTFYFPAVSRPAELNGQTQQSLSERAEWMVRTPIHFGPNQTFAGSQVQEGPAPWGPSREHPFGTDEVGRDVLARMVHGTRVSLFVGLMAMAICLLIGLLLGTLAGWYGGWVDALVSRLTEVMLSFPTLFFFLAVLGLMRVSSLWPLVLVLGMTRWTDISRLARAEVLRLRGLDFVSASRALGLSNARVLLVHVVPNALGPVLVAATFGVASAILIESALSFLGLGAPPPTASWGELLTQAHRYLIHPSAWWLAVFPGLAIAGSVIAIHLLGEGLRAALERR
jgi:peptide/nickel transport system permease protein